jgi:hypothetical protein
MKTQIEKGRVRKKSIRLKIKKKKSRIYGVFQIGLLDISFEMTIYLICSMYPPPS